MKFTLSSLIILLSFTQAQFEGSVEDTVMIDGVEYAKIIDEDYFDDLDYDDRMWSIAPSYGFGLIKGSTFSTIPSGYSMNIITPYGFNIGPFYYNISFAFGVFRADYRDFTVDEIGVLVSDTLLPVNPIYIGFGGDINFLGPLYSEGHIGKIGSGIGFRGFLGYDTGNLGEILGNNLDFNIKIGSEFYISSEITMRGNPSYWATLSLRGVYSFHTLFGS